MQDFLLKYPKTLLIVSHAREFLNVVCTDVVHLHRCRFLPLPGNILLPPASHLITRTLRLRDGFVSTVWFATALCAEQTRRMTPS